MNGRSIDSQDFGTLSLSNGQDSFCIVLFFFVLPFCFCLHCDLRMFGMTLSTRGSVTAGQ